MTRSSDLYIEKEGKTYILPNTSASNVSILAEDDTKSDLDIEIEKLRTIKADDEEVVHITGDETISGIKTFKETIRTNDIITSSLSYDSTVKVSNTNGASLELNSGYFIIKASKTGSELKGTGSGEITWNNKALPVDDTVVHKTGDEIIDGNKTFVKNITIKKDNSSLAINNTKYENGILTTDLELSSIYFYDKNNKETLHFYNIQTDSESSFIIDFTNPLYNSTEQTNFKICYPVLNYDKNGKITKIGTPYMRGPSSQTGEQSKIITQLDTANETTNGLLSLTAQTFVGDKTFTNNIICQESITLSKNLSVGGKITVETVDATNLKSIPNIQYLNTQLALKANENEAVHLKREETIESHKTISYDYPILTIQNKSEDNPTEANIQFLDSSNNIVSVIKSKYETDFSYSTRLVTYSTADYINYTELMLIYPRNGTPYVLAPAAVNGESAKVITLKDPASLTTSGIVTTGSQSFAGEKTFANLKLTNELSVNGSLSFKSGDTKIFDIVAESTTDYSKISFNIYKDDNKKSINYIYDTKAYVQIPSYYDQDNKTGNVITDIDYATATTPGILSTSEQEIKGKKTFVDGVTFASFDIEKGYVGNDYTTYDPRMDERIVTVKYMNENIGTQIKEKVTEYIKKDDTVKNLQEEVNTHTENIATINSDISNIYTEFEKVSYLDKEETISGNKTYTGTLLYNKTIASDADELTIPNIKFVNTAIQSELSKIDLSDVSYKSRYETITGGWTFTQQITGNIEYAEKIKTTSGIGDTTNPVYIDSVGNITPTTYKFSNYLPLTGGTITGECINTFNNAFRLIQGNYGAFFRNDGSKVYLLLTDSEDQYSISGNDFRPFTVDLATGETVCNDVSMINGNIVATGTITGNMVYNATWNDYAELFPKGEETEPGDIIALDENSYEKEQYIKATNNSSFIVGVHSNSYGHILGGDDDTLENNLKKYIPVGLAGRVDVNFIGIAKLGKPVVPSDIPGVGCLYNEFKNTPSQIIGYIVHDDDIKSTLLRKVKIKIGK